MDSKKFHAKKVDNFQMRAIGRTVWAVRICVLRNLPSLFFSLTAAFLVEAGLMVTPAAR